MTAQTKTMFPVAFTAAVLALVLVIAPGCSKRRQGPPPNTAAQVNGRVITNDALDREIERVGNRFPEAATSLKEKKDQVRREILEILIGGELLYQAAEKEGLKVTPEEIRQEQARVNAGLPKEHKAQAFTSEEIERKLMIEKFIKKRFADTTVITDEQGKKFYQENIDDFTRPENVTLRQILIKCPKDATKEERDKALAKARKLKAELDQGKDFGELARAASEDENALRGGEMGVVIRGQLERPVEKAAFALEVGQVSPVVASDLGYHLLLVEKKEPTYVIPYDDVKDKLKNYLRQREINRKIDAFIKEQRAAATIKTYV